MSEHGIYRLGQELEIIVTRDGIRLRINGSNRVASLPSSISPERVSALQQACRGLEELACSATTRQEYTDKEKELGELLSASLFQEIPCTAPDEQLAHVLGFYIGALRDGEYVRLLLSFEDGARFGNLPWELTLWKHAGREICLGRDRHLAVSHREQARAGTPRTAPLG